MHWGVEGGRDYKEGWRLPSQPVRPEGTVEYKKRALQTPLQPLNGNGTLAVKISLPPKEASDFLNFVIKDEATNTWYDLRGKNFQVPLRAEIVQALREVAESSEEEDDLPLIPLESLPSLPQDLCGIWAYIKWEAAGCPNRSKEEADAEYKNAIEEMTLLLRRGQELQDLWRVGNGDIKYAEYMKDMAALLVAPRGMRRGAEPAAEEGPVIPQDLIDVYAYTLWEKAGKPDGADFGSAARESIEKQLNSGKSLDELKAGVMPAAPVKGTPVSPVSPAQESSTTHLGNGMGMRQRSPFDLINRPTAPLLHDMENAEHETTSLLSHLVAAAGSDERCTWSRLYRLGRSELFAAVRQEDSSDPNSALTITVTTDIADPVVLHWGIKKPGKGRGWEKPPAKLLFPGSELLKDGIAAEAPFVKGAKVAAVPLQEIVAPFPKGHGATALTFVIRSDDGTAWWRDGGNDFQIPLPGPRRPVSTGDAAATFEDELSKRIIGAEVHSGGWTLMHRFNLASDILGDITSGGGNGPPDQALAKVFVWLRYSAMRQLTWQRNYNTQPRILGAAQERLTHAIADTYTKTSGAAREWARMLLTTVGRGGNAQAVRDEILAIMHRNKISEVKGTWMEEWHQKLHNNTTPDDVPICEAYLAYLASNGDLGTYWRVLSEAGITRQRLESFDRPIVTEPVFYAAKKDALIADFNNYLKILKSTHSGADLQASASAAAKCLPGAAKGYLGYVLGHVSDPAVLPLIEAAVETRTELLPALGANRETLYLDLALENVVRGAAERGAAASGTAAAALISPLLQNLALSLGDNEEVCYCLKAWQDLPGDVKSGRPPNKDSALKAMAVIDRIRRALAAVSDNMSAVLTPVATAYGEALGCEPWAVDLFAEEVVRGGPAFAVSLALSSIEPAMRAAAELGAWQVISPSSEAIGVVDVVPSLHEVQEKVYSTPTILLARRVTGEEEVPEGVVGVLSGDAPDVLSHLSVRARNMRVLFAACYDGELLDDLESLKGKVMQFTTTAAGAVMWSESSGNLGHNGSASNGSAGLKLSIQRARWCGKWVVPMDDFKDGLVGAKSRNLAGLMGRLPEWIKLPTGVTIPFATFDEVLKRRENNTIAKDLSHILKSMDPSSVADSLSKARELVQTVRVPEELKTELASSMGKAGIPVPGDDSRWELALNAVRAVWASKYNDRAYLSCKKVGLDFEAVSMAVLCQRVVPAQYAFVIHTSNPTNGDKNEVYCELVKGLGESIVSGTVPGTALAFSAKKNNLDNPNVLLYPSKSEGMFVEESLIFRSDSNGEDLEGYAGAGLYESVTMDVTYRQVVDYSSDPIIVDAEFRRQLMSNVAKAGAEIETALGSPQDVEGVVDAEGHVYVVQTRPQML